jgi:hypothetical protein
MGAAVAQQTSTRALQAGWALFLALALFLPDSVQAGERPYEIGGAQEELGRIRELAERLSKQNLFYQLHLADQRKQDLHDTSAELERSLELLRKGSVAFSVAAPPNQEVRDQISQVEKAWGPVRRMALASPYDYLRRANEFMPRRHRLGDPLFIRSFDRMSQALIEEVDRLMALYQKECMKTDYDLCELASEHGYPIMLTERVVKELVFVYAGPGDESDRERLRETRDAIDAHYFELTPLPILQEMTDPARGDAAAFVSGLWSSINEDWGRLRLEVDLAISGRAEEINLKKVLEIQARLVETWERLNVVALRFIEAKYAG